MKKFAAGLLEWNDRIGVADLKMFFEATPSVLVSRNGCRIVNAIVILYFRWIFDEKRVSLAVMKRCFRSWGRGAWRQLKLSSLEELREATED